MTGPQESLRAQVRAALHTAGISQAEASRQLGLTTKHMNQMLTGRTTLTLAWAERILDLCDMRIVIGIQLRTDR
ncbi:helix-turn-helix transcriptional regulator [Streptomyces sp. NPDC005953]|uniref:helix-turn-helix transcriptional regulator n=1 Tax=Streptomyces sp. NPDC005953 TaxID=3156719 RepID=UPI0033E0A64B